MKNVARLMCLLVVGGLLAGVSTIQQDWVAGLGLDFWSLPDLHRTLAEASQRQEELCLQQEGLSRRIAVKSRLIDQLAAGEIPLRDVVDQFEVLNAEFPSCLEFTCQTHPAPTVRESVCKQVMSWVSGRIDGLSAERREQIMARLEREARALRSAATAGGRN